MADEMFNLTGLWENTSKAGTKYLGGSFTVEELAKFCKGKTKIRVMIFRETDPKGDRPKWGRVCLSEAKDRPQEPPAF